MIHALPEVALPAARAAVAEPRVRTQFWDAAHPEDRLAWLDLWQRWPGREVWAHPDYVRLFAGPGDRALAAAIRTPKGGILYPIIVRSMASEPWATGGSGFCDITNAYGYGGPFAWNVEASEAADFHADFDFWVRRMGAVTSFARLSLFEDDLLPFPGNVIDRGTNIVRSLELTPEQLWFDYEAKVRKNVQKARRDGLEIRFDERGDGLDDFIAVYKSTMDRRKALAQYYFSKSFFESLMSRLPGQVILVHAVQEGKVVSSEMVLISAHTAYSFLGGTFAEAFGSRPNDLLKHECFMRFRERGLKQEVLGGTYAEGDGLLRYKKSFAPTGERRFRVGQVVHDPAALASLVEQRKNWESSQDREWTPAEGFFPAYRS
jgi:hypothetical protein